MFSNLTNRLSKLEADLVGRECTCPSPEPEPLRPGFRVVDRREVHLGLMPCPTCKGLRDLVIVESIIGLADDTEIALSQQ